MFQKLIAVIRKFLGRNETETVGQSDIGTAHLQYDSVEDWMTGENVPRGFIKDSDPVLRDKYIRQYGELRRHLYAKHITTLSSEDHKAINDGCHPSQRHRFAGNAQPCSGQLKRHLLSLGLDVSDVHLGLCHMDRIVLSVETPEHLDALRFRELPWLFQGFEIKYISTDRNDATEESCEPEPPVTRNLKSSCIGGGPANPIVRRDACARHEEADFTGMTTHVKWTAQLNQVREVSLLGSADLGFWQARLAEEELTPVNREGRATIVIVSAAGKFAGIQFRELSVSVVVASTADAAAMPSYFLIRAFNSNRFFAFCERFFFSTPYDYANVRVEYPAPTQTSVTRNGRKLFIANMQNSDASTGRRPTQQRDNAWMARIMLPSNGRPAGSGGKMFFARIRGITHVYPFIAGADSISIQEHVKGDVFDLLRQSHFKPIEWIVRSNATHGKSKTYSRKELVVLEPKAIGEQCGEREPSMTRVLI